MLERLDETIVAVSSAAGYGPLGIVRLSGPDAVGIVDPLAVLPSGMPLGAQAGFSRYLGEIRLDGTLRIPAFFMLFRAPRSYTRQDLIEIGTLGAPPLLDWLRERLLGLGAVPALPGEFTARAFLNGAMDLATAEAVAGIIRAQSDIQLRAARRMLDGRNTRDLHQVRDDLAEILALVEADIDFAEEPIEFITPDVLRRRLSQQLKRLRGLVTGGEVLERFDRLPRILLFGRPNAGKSTLMNRLSGTNRAICAAVAGTTRDILSAPIRLPGGEAILLDAAGVDSSDDEVIAGARAKTLSEADRVDLVCVVVDGTAPNLHQLQMALEPMNSPRIVTAINKCELLNELETRRIADEMGRRVLGPAYWVSARDGRGVEELRRAFAMAIGGNEQTAMHEAVLITERQRSAVLEGIASLQRALALIAEASATIDCADVVAFELRETLDWIGSVSGAVSTEELLGRVFARFCIGK